jgi:hypothetical protein
VKFYKAGFPHFAIAWSIDVHQVSCGWIVRWDYGYQTTAMANRTVLVDNNTWNNTHIATVGRAMASPEKQAWEIYRSLDVTHVLVIFGGFIGCAIARSYFVLCSCPAHHCCSDHLPHSSGLQRYFEPA